jgi:predicted outer membrane repeat protein
MIEIEEILREINTSCSKLCFVSQIVKGYINENVDALRSEPPSELLLQLISASLKVTNSTHIYTQHSLINAFISTVVIENSLISSMELDEHGSIKIISSSLVFSGMTLENITTTTSYAVIDVSADSTLNISDSVYRNSNSLLFNMISSKGSIDGLTMTNITQADSLFLIYSCTDIEIKNFTAVSSSSASESLVSIKQSSGLTFDTFSLTNINQTLITVENSNFNEMKNLNFTNSSKPLVIKNSVINLMSGCYFSQNGNFDIIKGGVIYMHNSELTISTSQFTSNKAQIGGAIHFDCTSTTRCKLEISGTTFKLNEAKSKGGAIYYEYRRPTLTNNTFENNSAAYGPDLASYPVKIQMLDHSESVISNVGSNTVYEETLNFALLDYDNQTMVLNNVNQIIINPVNSSQASVVGTNAVLLKNGVASFTNLVAIAQPGSQNIKFQASSKAINNAKINQIYGSAVSDNFINFNFRNCMPGEQIIGNRCVPCSAGSYSLEWNSKTCESCLENAVCLGRDVIEVEQGFWRRTTNSTNIVECINQDACDGGYNKTSEYPVN